MSFNALDFVDQEQKATGGGGGGYAAKMQIEFGFKLFVKDVSNEDSWFPYIPSKDDKNGTRAKAEKQAKKTLAKLKEQGYEMSDSAKPYGGLGITLFKNSVLNRDVNWENDRFFFETSWTTNKDYNDLIIPKLREASKASGVSIGEDPVWGRLTFQETLDPENKRQTNQEGEDVPKLVAFVAELYPNKKAAEKAAEDMGSSDGDSGSSDSPEGMDAKTWEGIADEIHGELDKILEDNDKVSRKKRKAIAEDYEVDIEWVNRVYDDMFEDED